MTSPITVVRHGISCEKVSTAPTRHYPPGNCFSWWFIIITSQILLVRGRIFDFFVIFHKISWFCSIFLVNLPEIHSLSSINTAKSTGFVKNAEKIENSSADQQNFWSYDDKPSWKAISRGVVPGWCGADFFALVPYAPPFENPMSDSSYLKLQIKIHDPAGTKSYDDNYFNCHQMKIDGQKNTVISRCYR